MCLISVQIVCVFLLHASGVQLAACDRHSHHTGVEGQQERVTGFVQGQRERLPRLYGVIAAPTHTHIKTINTTTPVLLQLNTS